MKHLLVTGGAGFIGSNFILYYLQHNPNVHLINIDALTYAGHLDNLSELEGHERYTFIHGDICDRKLLERLFTQYAIQGIIHFAAESHVDNSIAAPQPFIQTNIVGTFALLEVAKHHWMKAPGQYNAAYQGARFHHISTDEVYGMLGQEGYFTETTPYAPNNPYSASKAASDFLVQSYHHTYGMNVVITHSSNNYGPKQHSEKFIPTIISKALAGDPIPIYGDGTQIREWLYVLDHCKGIALAYEKGKAGETYNLGAGEEYTNLDIAQRVCDILDNRYPRTNKQSYRELIAFVADRPGHDFRYAIDTSKIANTLGWKPQEPLARGLAHTVAWHLAQHLGQHHSGTQPSNHTNTL